MTLPVSPEAGPVSPEAGGSDRISNDIPLLSIPRSGAFALGIRNFGPSPRPDRCPEAVLRRKPGSPRPVRFRHPQPIGQVVSRLQAFRMKHYFPHKPCSLGGST